jgi:hypothetical protein
MRHRQSKSITILTNINAIVQKALKQRIFSRHRGDISISATEPVPINLVTHAPRASTKVSLKLLFSPKNHTQIDVCQWKPIVKSRLRTRTFSSIRELHHMPTLAASRFDPFQKMVELTEMWEVRECGPIAWRREPLPGSDIDVNQGTWTADLSLPVSVPKTLLPTFLNLLSARQYALVLRVGIVGLRHGGVLELVLPLQLTCCDQDKSLEVGDNLSGDSQEDGGEWYESLARYLYLGH